MKISTRIQYGSRFLITLATWVEEGYVSIIGVAKKQDIPVKYLENIVTRLKAAGIVKVKRGARGGYKLTRDPADINMLEIFQALDGNVISFELNQDANDTPNQKVFKELLSELESNVTGFLSSKSLKDIADSVNQKIDNQMFYI